MSNKYMVVGANFFNKGAQSMLFITVDELKKRFPDCEVYFASTDQFDDSIYNFGFIYYSPEARYIALHDGSYVTILKRGLIDIVKRLIGRKVNTLNFMDAKKIIPQCTAIIDVSGFNLGKKWSAEIQETYLDNIRIAKKYNIPIVMMPQSFGSFDYPKEKMYLLKDIEKLLVYPKVIFAREKEGYEMLTEHFGLKNVQLSTDLVLQNSGVNLSNIYKNPSKEAILPRVKGDSVAIIPNKQCFNHGDEDRNIQMYTRIINQLLQAGKNVYVFRHAKEDFPICKLIAEQFQGNKNVVLLDNEFSCLEYDEFVKKFDFVICSRFHGVVHAYRNYIPCILLGWAIKYKELAANVGQEQFAFDITESNFNSDQVKNVIDQLLINKDKESAIIKAHVTEIRKNNCFDQIVGYLQ